MKAGLWRSHRSPLALRFLPFYFFTFLPFPSLRSAFAHQRNNGLDAALDAMNRMKKVRVSAQGGKIVVDAML